MKSLYLSFILLMGFFVLKSQCDGFNVDGFSSTNVSCFGGLDGSANVNVVGGTAPYTYLWDDPLSQTTQGCIDMLAGVYTCTVTDANACSVVGTVVISEPTQLSLTPVYTNISCNSLCDGTVSLSVSGGVAPYSYAWNTPFDQSQSTVSGLCTGVYNCVVVDANGCQESVSVTLTEPDAVTVSTTTSDITCNNLCDGYIYCGVSGGSGMYTYLWSDGQTTANLNNACVGTYSVEVTDDNGCTSSITDILNQPELLIGTISYDHSVDPCSWDCGYQVTMTADGGVSPYSYSSDLFSVSGVLDSSFNVDTCYSQGQVYHIIDANQCTVELTINVDPYVSDPSCEEVWPGDANSDGLVDNTDLLNIGIAHGTSGTSRNELTLDPISFDAHYSDPWSTNFVSGINYAHADCNGDGIVNDNDTTAIIQNYGLAHAKSMEQVNSGDVKLSFGESEVYLGLQESHSIALKLGDQADQVNAFYGLAFKISYDANLIQAGSMNISYSNSWLDSESDVLDIQYNFEEEGVIEIGITKTNHTSISGFGQIGELNYIVIDNLSGKMAAESDSTEFIISNITLIDELASESPVSGDTSLLIVSETVGVENLKKDLIEVYPNPSVNGVYQMNTLDLVSVKVFDITGKVVYENSKQDKLLDLSSFSGGVYHLQVNGNQHVLLIKK